jgi:hypothetical protein
VIMGLGAGEEEEAGGAAVTVGFLLATGDGVKGFPIVVAATGEGLGGEGVVGRRIELCLFTMNCIIGIFVSDQRNTLVQGETILIS